MNELRQSSGAGGQCPIYILKTTFSSSTMENTVRATADLQTWSDPKLVEAAKSGQPEAFGKLCERHAEKMRRVAFRITRNREDAEDAVQESFLRAFVHLNAFDERSRFATWLTRIAINSALTHLRKTRGRREVSIDDPHPPAEFRPPLEIHDHAPNPEVVCRLRERRQIIRAAISRLRPRIRKVVELQQLRGFSVKEIARMLGISIAAAKTRMFRARAALRRIPLA